MALIKTIAELICGLIWLINLHSNKPLVKCIELAYPFLLLPVSVVPMKALDPRVRTREALSGCRKRRPLP